MSLNTFYKFSTILESHGMENVFTVDQSVAMAEDITVMESVPERLMDVLVENYTDEQISNMVESCKEVFEGEKWEKVVIEKGEEEEEDEKLDENGQVIVVEKFKPLVGKDKKQRDAKAQLMTMGNKDPEISKIKEQAKTKIVTRLKKLGLKNGINVKKIDFTKIKI